MNLRMPDATGYAMKAGANAFHEVLNEVFVHYCVGRRII